MYRARGVSFRGKFVLSRHVAYKTKWGHHVAKRSSDAWQAYPEVIGGRYPGKIRLSRPRGEMGPGDMCRVYIAAVRYRRARQTSKSGPCGDCKRVLARGVNIREKSILSRNGGYKKRGLPCCET